MTEQPPVAGPTAAEPATCYRHPQREAHIRCTRCERRICPDCMIPASVGFQCPECVHEGHKGVRQGRTLFGGQVTDDPGWVSKVLIAINVVAFVAQQVSDEVTRRFFDVGLALDPVTGETFGVADGEVYRLLTSAFLHGGVFHLLLNMYALFVFGPQLEGALGRVRFSAVYVVSALGGSALSYAFSAPNQPSLGASGAVFGLLGAYLVISRRLRRDTTPVLVLLAINFGYGFLVPRIDWRAHLGGLVAGALVAVALAYAPKARRGAVQAAGAAAVLLVVVALVAWRTAELT
ncbi:MAG: rhomboid family intramembrane serine protease [Actinomycetes bacterium]